MAFNILLVDDSLTVRKVIGKALQLAEVDIGELFEAIAGILREGQARGELRTDLDPEVACYIFVGGLDTVMTSRVLALMPEDESSTDSEDARTHGQYVQLAKTVVELFVRGMAGTAPER